jgi:exopolyphosphatase / guanosine-5'-triphosphate,3'-diphosphate pyrophosphatase
MAAQVMALRLAVLLCHTRNAPEQPLPVLSAEARQIHLRLTSGWAAQHPRTLHLLQGEVEAWSKVGLLRLQTVQTG